MTTENQPISRLDECVDEMLRALALMPQLDRMVTAMRVHEEALGELGPDAPGVVDALAGADFRAALIGVMDEVLAMQEGARRGGA